MRRTIVLPLAGIAVVLAFPGIAQAGMPSITLSDIARIRVQTISFFLLGFLLSAFGIQRLWNYLGRDFTALPRLTYRRSLCLTALWGLLFVLVLTMISGTRELMTPGAWEKYGATYRLTNQPDTPTPQEQLDKQRYEKLDLVREHLWQYANLHNNTFPPDPGAANLTGNAWVTPGAFSIAYLYVRGQSLQDMAVPLVYEPDVFGEPRLVLLTNGEIRRMTAVEIAQELARVER
jgi:hypothetical protein